MYVFLPLFLFFYTIHSNLIYDGNFQSYTPLYQNSDLEQCQFYPSNYSCWFNQNGGNIEIKDKLFNLTIGKSADMISDIPYVLCQNVQLIQSQVYEISFQVGNIKSINSSTIVAKIDETVIANYTNLGQYAMNTAKSKFVATRNMSTLCFSSTDTRLNSYYMGRGPVISNITLIELKLKQIFIHCKMNKQRISEIAIDCDTSQQTMEFIEHIKNKIEIDIEGEAINPYHVQNNQGTFLIIADYKKSKKLANITLTLNQPVYFNNEHCLVNFMYSTSSITFIYQQQNQIKRTDLFYYLTERLMSITNSAFTALRSTLAAYFIANIICFWNLCLLYNLLNITTVPLFLKLFYEQLLYKFFNLSSIMNWLNNNISGFQDKFAFVNSLDRERMVENKHSFGWFGYFGISSQFLANNTEQILTMAVFIVKLFALAKIRKIIWRQFATMFPKGIQFVSIFIKQLFVAVIFICLSSFTDILQSGFMESTEKVNGVLQYLALWMGLMAYPIYFIIQMRIKRKKLAKKYHKNLQLRKQILKKKQIKINENQTKQQKRKQIKSRKIVIQCMDNLLNLSFYIIVPSLAILDCPIGFLIIMTVLIWTRCWWFLRFSSQLVSSLRKKLFTIMNLLAWFLHHHIYVIFYVLEIVQVYFHIVFDDNVFNGLKICAYVSILTILIGGACEILNFIFSLFIQIHFYMKIICKKLNPNKIIPNRQKNRIEKIQIDRKSNKTNKNQKRVIIIMRIGPKGKKKDIDPKLIKGRDQKNSQRNKGIGIRNVEKQGKLNNYLKPVYNKSYDNQDQL